MLPRRLMILLLVALLTMCVSACRRPVPGETGTTIVLDPGHGGQFTNRRSGLREEVVNLDIARRVARELRSRGHRVVLTRADPDDMNATATATWGWDDRAGTWAKRQWPGTTRDRALRSDLQARVDRANEVSPRVFVSIHCNGSSDPSRSGTEAFAAPEDAAGLALAACIVDATCTRAGTVNRRERIAGFYVLRWTSAPAALVEVAYLTNSADARRLRSRVFRKHAAEGIADGIERWIASYPEEYVARSPKAAAR